jgi:hypothetical protein
MKPCARERQTQTNNRYEWIERGGRSRHHQAWFYALLALGRPPSDFVPLV